MEEGSSNDNKQDDIQQSKTSFYFKEDDPDKEAFPPGSPGYWMKAFSYMTGLGSMTTEERQAFKRDQGIRHRDMQCKRCESYRDYLFQYSPIVRFMADNIRKVNGNVSKDNVHCVRCVGNMTGGFIPDDGSIVLCQNQLRNRGHCEDNMAHEMVHAFDRLRFNTDWSNLKHHACTEIRASNLSGECRWIREFFTRRVPNFTLQQQACVRRRAALSVMGNPECKSREMAEQVVDQVFDSCYKDTRPFAEIYR